MRVFWVKLIGLIIVCLVLFTYQTQAHNLARISKALDEKEQTTIEDQNQSKTDASQYKDGKFTGKGTGFSGEMTVEVTIEGGSIKDIEIVETGDDKSYLERAMKLLDEIKESQTTEGIDTISGATYSSNGILEAVSNALSESKG